MLQEILDSHVSTVQKFRKVLGKFGDHLHIDDVKFTTIGYKNLGVDFTLWGTEEILVEYGDSDEAITAAIKEKLGDNIGHFWIKIHEERIEVQVNYSSPYPA